MPSKLSSCVIGIDVGGTNTDAVILQNEAILAWHKTPTTTDIQSGVERAIEEVVEKAEIPSDRVGSVKIGTTVRISLSYLKFDELRYIVESAQSAAATRKSSLGSHTGCSNSISIYLPFSKIYCFVIR
jgi:activator of 2-hydroxyglutaryl-CoA dehydratase